MGTALLTTPRAVALGWPTANIDTEGRNRAAGAPSTPDADDLASASAADALAPSDARGLRLAVAALGWALLGIVLGLLLHPYVPRNLEFASLHLLPKVVPSAQLDVPVGQEWNAFSLRGFVTRAGPVAALTALGMVPPLLALARRRAPDWRTIMLGGIAVGFMVMTARSQRLIEYFPALAVLFCAWSWAHPSSTGAADVARLARGIWARSAARLCRNACLASPGARGEGRWSRLLARMNRAGAPSSPLGAWGGRLAAAWPWLAGAALAPVLLTSITVARRDANNGLAWDTYRDAALWLAANTPAGARVFTTDWDDFPHLFFWNTHNTYLTGLDPTYMYLYDPRLYRRWRDVGAGRVAEPSRVIWQEFGARYVVSDRARKHEAFLRVAAADPGLEEVLRTRTAVVFRVRDARD